MSSLSTFNTWFFTNIISDRVHCNPLSCVASGSRCHTADYLKETKDAEVNSLVLCAASRSPPPPGSMCSLRSTSSPLTMVLHPPPIYTQDPLLCMGINEKADVVHLPCGVPGRPIFKFHPPGNALACKPINMINHVIFPSPPTNHHPQQ